MPMTRQQLLLSVFLLITISSLVGILNSGGGSNAEHAEAILL